MSTRVQQLVLAGIAAASSLFGVQAQAQTVLTTTRSSSFTYYVAGDGAKNGLLKTETVEPNDPQSCVTTTYTYDAYGNKTGATTANCVGATGLALFTTHSSASVFAAGAAQSLVIGAGTSSPGTKAVDVPAGQFASTLTNALSQSETHKYDPRFGAAVSLTGPNALTTTWQVDDFGRKVVEKRADGTSTVTYYCTFAVKGISDLSANSAGCSTLGYAANEIPPDAVSVVHSEPRDTADAKSGPFSRVYVDGQGRKIREASESFDGPAQPGAPGALVVKDTDYNAFGAVVLTTQPYYLATGSSTTSGSNDRGMSYTTYDVLGRAVSVASVDVRTTRTDGSVSNAGGNGGVVAFGARGSFQAAVTTVAYAGLKTTTTNDVSQTRVEEKNIDGRVVRVTDATLAQLAHQYDAAGNLIRTKDALQNLVIATYDVRGRKLSINDPDAGLTQFNYDALGQLVWQQNANQLVAGTATTMVYDALGRMTRRTDPEYVSNWYYDAYADASACAHGAGKLCESVTTNGVDRKFVFDSLGRPMSSRTTVTSGPSFATALSYDTLTGRVATQTYPTGLKLSYVYSDTFTGKRRGYLAQVQLATTATVNPLPATKGGAAGSAAAVPGLLWQSGSVNAWGQSESSSLGNGVTTRAVFNPATGRVIGASAGAGSATDVLNYSYNWDSISRLTGRADANGDGTTGAVLDTYQYDSINRLTQYQVSAPAIPGLLRTVDLKYNAIGNIIYKTDVGAFDYAPFGNNGAGVTNPRPHAVTSVAGSTSISYSYDANGNVTAATGGKYASVSYTSFNLPDGNNGVKGPSGTPKYTWQYDESHQRIKETRFDASGTRTTWYAHPDNAGGLAFESETAASGAVSNRHFVSAGGQTIVLVSTAALPVLPAGQTTPPVISSIALVKVEYWHKDQLGSLVSTTDHTGTVTARYAYDPFGKRRYASGNYDPFGNLIIDWVSDVNNGTARGFTGHEHLDDIGIVNMNGRLFDPMLGRFMQPDPFIQDPLNLQNFNRYGYCYNNPMTCTDPTGLFSLKKFLIGVFVNPYIAVRELWSSSVGRQVIGIAVAFCLGPAGYGAIIEGGGLAAGLANSAIAGFVSGAISSGTLKGGIQGAFSAAMFYGAGELVNGAFTDGFKLTGNEAIAVHGVVGCVTSMAGGGKCGSGALSAAFSKAATVNGFVGSDPISGTITSAIVGGTASVLGGGKFANGAQTGAFGYLFNHLLHILGQRRVGSSNVFGHSAMAISNSGLYSFGNDKPLGMSVTDYVATQSLERDQVITYIPTTAEQDQAARRYVAQFQDSKLSDSKFESIMIDNCSNHSLSIMEAAGKIGIDQYNYIALAGVPILPGTISQAAATMPGAIVINLPRGATMSPALKSLLSTFDGK